MLTEKTYKVFKFYDVDGRNMKFRNFAGKAGKFNAEGDRNFCLLLSEDDAEDLKEEGYNVKYLKPRSEDEDPVPYIQVKVKYKNRFGEALKRQPKIVQVTRYGKTYLDEETISNLDWADIDDFSIAINPSYRDGDDGSIKATAYVQTLYVRIVEDEFESRYADDMDSAQNIVDEED